jgi:hypothetical protein
MTKLSLDRNFFEAEKLAESQPFSTVSQVTRYKLKTKKAGPWLTLPGFVAKGNDWLNLLKPRPSHQGH